MELHSFDVVGYRSLADVRGIPIDRPTILTGHNDSGKSATLRALGFLLGDSSSPLESDYTFAVAQSENGGETHGDAEAKRIEACGTFTLDADEQTTMDLPGEIRIRRIASPDTQPVYEVERSVPREPKLRGLSIAKLDELKSRCEELGLTPDGPRNRKDSWLTPLEEAAAEADRENTWDPAPRELVARLPRFLAFSSTAEPDPQSEVKAALGASFSQHIADEQLAGKVSEIEDELTTRLTADAARLQEHILARCPDLSGVSVLPQVSMRQGFAGVLLKASQVAGEDVDLQASGAGRKRLITLAVGEWASDLLAEGEDASKRCVVIAYDEPDTHLDYARQRDLMGLFRQQCDRPGVRMVVATHSLNLIDRVDIASVVLLKLAAGRTTVDRLAVDEDQAVDAYLSEVSTTLGLRNSTLLHERCFVIVEGATEQQSLPLLFRKTVGLPMQSMGLALIAADGNEGALKVGGLLKKKARRVVLLLDTDTKDASSTKKMFRPDRLRGEGFDPDVDVVYLGTSELEDMFTDAQWAEVANANWPHQDHRDWRPDEIASCRIDSKFSSALLSLLRASSDDGPWGKPDMMTAMARHLVDVETIPLDLRRAFEHLVSMTDT